MKAYRKLATMAFAIFLSLLFTMPSYSASDPEISNLPKHYTVISLEEMFTKCFSQDSNGRYSMKGDKPILLLFVISRCGPCVQANKFLNWTVDYHKDKSVDFYKVFIKAGDENLNRFYDFANQYGISKSDAATVPIIMLFNRYGNLLSSTFGFLVIENLFKKNVERVPEWKNINSNDKIGESVIKLLKAYDNL